MERAFIWWVVNVSSQLSNSSSIVYPFPTTIAESPFEEMDGDQELLRFHFRVFPLWKLNAELFIREHIVSMYALLPTMGGVNIQMLSQAIDEMAQQYKGSDTEFANQLKWLGVMLRRAEILPLEDKQQVQERLDMWDNLLEQDPYIQKKVAKSLAEGEMKGRIEGEMKGLRKAVVRVVKGRFPLLTELAEQKAAQIDESPVLYYLIEQLSTVQDEAAARWLLRPSAA